MTAMNFITVVLIVIIVAVLTPAGIYLVDNHMERNDALERYCRENGYNEVTDSKEIPKEYGLGIAELKIECDGVMLTAKRFYQACLEVDKFSRCTRERTEVWS